MHPVHSRKPYPRDLKDRQRELRLLPGEPKTVWVRRERRERHLMWGGTDHGGSGPGQADWYDGEPPAASTATGAPADSQQAQVPPAGGAVDGAQAAHTAPEK